MRKAGYLLVGGLLVGGTVEGLRRIHFELPEGYKTASFLPGEKNKTPESYSLETTRKKPKRERKNFNTRTEPYEAFRKVIRSGTNLTGLAHVRYDYVLQFPRTPMTSDQTQLANDIRLDMAFDDVEFIGEQKSDLGSIRFEGFEYNFGNVIDIDLAMQKMEPFYQSWSPKEVQAARTEIEKRASDIQEKAAAKKIQTSLVVWYPALGGTVRDVYRELASHDTLRRYDQFDSDRAAMERAKEHLNNFLKPVLSDNRSLKPIHDLLQRLRWELQ